MEIHRIDPLRDFSKTESASNAKKVKNNNRNDSVNLSKEAIQKYEDEKILEIVNGSVESKNDKINLLKEKINDPSYLSKDKINFVVEKLADKFFKF